EPPATEDEIRASALQFVRKLSGFNVPSKANENVFNDAVEEVADAARRLLQSLATTSPPRNREIEAEKARARSRQRFEFGGAEAATMPMVSCRLRAGLQPQWIGTRSITFIICRCSAAIEAIWRFAPPPQATNTPRSIGRGSASAIV